MKKKLKYFILIIVAGFAGFIYWSIYSERSLAHSKRTERICIDNPTTDSIVVILDADTLPMTAHSTVRDFPVFRGEHHFRAYDEGNNVLCDTVFNIRGGIEEYMLNPTHSKYVFWAVDYTSRPDLESEFNPMSHTMVVIEGDTFFGNMHIDSSLINEITMKDHRYYNDNMDPDRKVEEFQTDRGSPDIDFCYFIRYDEFRAVYSNLKPSSEKDNLRTALHNCTNTFAQHVNFDSYKVQSRTAFMQMFQQYGHLVPEALVDSFVAQPQVFRDFDPPSYDEMVRVYKQMKMASDDEQFFVEQKLLPYTIYNFRLAETGWFKPEYVLFRRSVLVPSGDSTQGIYYLPDGSVDDLGAQSKYTESEVVFRRR